MFHIPFEFRIPSDWMFGIVFLMVLCAYARWLSWIERQKYDRSRRWERPSLLMPSDAKPLHTEETQICVGSRRGTDWR